MKLNPATERPDTFEDMIDSPSTVRISQDPLEQAFFASTILDKTTPENFEQVVEYLLRPEIPDVLELLIMTLICRKDPSYCDTKGFMKWAKACKHIKFDKF